MKRFTKYPAALLLAFDDGALPGRLRQQRRQRNPRQYQRGGQYSLCNCGMQISQEDWDSHRQYVDLATGITMSYVEMGVEDGPALILQHGMTDNMPFLVSSRPLLCRGRLSCVYARSAWPWLQ